MENKIKNQILKSSKPSSDEKEQMNNKYKVI